MGNSVTKINTRDAFREKFFLIIKHFYEYKNWSISLKLKSPKTWTEGGGGGGVVFFM